MINYILMEQTLGKVEKARGLCQRFLRQDPTLIDLWITSANLERVRNFIFLQYTIHFSFFTFLSLSFCPFCLSLSLSVCLYQWPFDLIFSFFLKMIGHQNVANLIYEKTLAKFQHSFKLWYHYAFLKLHTSNNVDEVLQILGNSVLQFLPSPEQVWSSLSKPNQIYFSFLFLILVFFLNDFFISENFKSS